MGGVSLAARLLALSFFVIAGAGLYAVVLNSDLKAAEMQLGMIAKDRDSYKVRVEQYASQGKSDARALSTCQAQLTDMTTQMEASATKTSMRR